MNATVPQHHHPLLPHHRSSTAITSNSQSNLLLRTNSNQDSHSHHHHHHHHHRATTLPSTHSLNNDKDQDQEQTPLISSSDSHPTYTDTHINVSSDKTHTVKQLPRSQLDIHSTRVLSLFREILQLQSYVDLNYLGFGKILKKYEKNTGINEHVLIFH